VAALTPPEYQVEIIDENVEPIDFVKNFDLVGITAMTQQATRAYEIADLFRARNCKVVIGGIHASILPEEAKAHADSVVIGEAENVWSTLLGDYQSGNLSPFYKSREVVDLHKSPRPRYDLLINKQYSVIWVQASRGCPYNCSFCAASNIFGKAYRTKTIEQVIGEISEIKRLFGDIRIGFGDDNLLTSPFFSEELLTNLSSLNIRWAGQVDIGAAINDRLLALLKKSGCTFLFIGFESLDKTNLSNININKNKIDNISAYPALINKIQSFGIGVMGAFIIGFDNDDQTTFPRIRDFIIDNNLYDSQISILTPIPGTDLRAKLSNENRILATSWDNYTFFDVNFTHPKLSKVEIENGLLEIYKQTNSREVYLRKLDFFKKVQKALIQG